MLSRRINVPISRFLFRLRPDLSRNLSIFCQKARSIVVDYGTIGAFSWKKPG